MKTVLISGANRGIGLAFCKQYAQQDWRVIACCRLPQQADELNRLAAVYPQLEVHKMDVCDRAAVDVLALQLQNTALDLLIANAGIYGDSRGQGLGNLDYSDWMRTMEVNVLGAVKVVEAFLPQLRQSTSGHIVALSSQMASIEDNSSGGSLLYRSSKAALNAAMKSISLDLQEQNIGLQIFHPGWVKTDMGGSHALINAETSVKGMIQQINAFKLSQTGQFIKYDGSLLPW